MSEAEAEKSPEKKPSAGQKAAAEANYLAEKGPGFATIVEISAKAASLQQATVPVQPGEHLSLSFRVFETATPVKVAATVSEEGCTEDAFQVEFQNLDIVLKRVLLTVISKLKRQSPDQLCTRALLADGS